MTSLIFLLASCLITSATSEKLCIKEQVGNVKKHMTCRLDTENEIPVLMKHFRTLPSLFMELSNQYPSFDVCRQSGSLRNDWCR